MTEETIDYSYLIDNAMRGVVRDVLRAATKSGLPGDHHFYITFRTDHPNTRVSDTLKNRYPHEMTIVLQHQFWDFRVDEQKFTVTLSFGGVPEKLVIPFVALTAFADPSVKFGLQFHQPDAPEDEEENESLMFENEPSLLEEDGAIAANKETDGTAEIISLDSFRKK